MKEITVSGAISYGWEAMKQNFVLFLWVLLTITGLSVVSEIANTPNRPFLSMLVGVAVLAFALILQLGLYRIALNIIDGKRVHYQQLYTEAQRFPDFLLSSVLYLLVVVGGLILLIVPGIILMVKYQFYGFFIVDKKMSPLDALKASGHLTQDHKWPLFKLWLAVLGINILGALALLVGLVATIPTGELAIGYAYRTLGGQEGQRKARKRT